MDTSNLLLGTLIRSLPNLGTGHRQPAAQAQRSNEADAMPFTAKDLDAYRRDERLGHKLLTPEERLGLLKVRARRAPVGLSMCCTSTPKAQQDSNL